MKKILITIIVLIIVGVGSYFVFFDKPVDINQQNVPAVSTDQTSSSQSETTVPPVTQTQPVVIPPSSNTVNTPATTPVQTQTPTLAPSNVSISIKGFAFNPQTITIKTGTKVTWTNNDSAPHTVTSDTGGLLNSPTLSPGQSFSFTYTNTGTTNYHCAIHPMMKGSIVVQ